MKHKTYQDLTESIRLIMEKPQDFGAGMGYGIPGGAGTVVALSQQAPSAPSTQPSQSGSQPAELSQAEKLAKDRGFDYNSLPQWRKDAFQANAARKSMEGMLSGQIARKQDGTLDLGASKQLRDTIKNSAEYKAQMATFKQYHTETNPIQPVERNGGGFSVGRGVGGKPVITGGSYKNPNSAEARVRADVDAGKLPASFGQYQGNRLPMDLEAEQKAAGDEAASKELGFDVAGLSQQQIRDKVRSNVKRDTSAEEHHLRMQDLENNGPMPKVQVGQEIKDFDSKYAEISKEIPKLDREYKDASALQSFKDSLKGEEQKNQAQMDLRAKSTRAKQDDDDREDMYAGMRQHQTLPHGEIPPAPQSATVGSMIPNQNAASRVATLFAPGVSTPKSSFKDAVKSVAQSSTPNVPQTEPVKDEDNSEARLRVTRSYNADKAAASYDAKEEILRKRAEREAREREDAQRNTTPKIGKVNPISPY